jgi:hypothetical protein
MYNMAIQPDDLHQRRLAIAAARARSEAAAAGELTPVPSTLDNDDELSPESKEAFLALLRPGGAYWEASEVVSKSDSELA